MDNCSYKLTITFSILLNFVTLSASKIAEKLKAEGKQSDESALEMGKYGPPVAKGKATPKDLKQVRAEFLKFQQQVNKDVDEPVYPFATHAACIFLDEGAQYFDTITFEFIEALEQKACPIIVSAYLLLHLVTYRTRKIIQEKSQPEENRLCTQIYENQKKILAHYKNKNTITQKLFDILSNQIEKFEKHYKKMPNYPQNMDSEIYHMYSCFYGRSSLSDWTDGWILRRYNQDLFILIPRNYVPAHPASITSKTKKMESASKDVSKKITDPSSFSDQELQLGLKIDHMDSIDTLSMQELVDEFNRIGEKRKKNNLADYFLADLNSIFIQRSEYTQYLRKNPALFIPRWALYLSGHGNIMTTIASIPITQFDPLLTFLQTNIMTSLFMYNSCYAAGTNAETIYKDYNAKFRSKLYTYPIITMALTDMPIDESGHSLQYKAFRVNLETKILQPISTINFSEFVRQITAFQTPDFASLVSLFYPFEGKKIDNDIRIAQIRLPGLQWFSPLDYFYRVATLDAQLANARTEPLDVMKFFGKKDLQYLLLTTTDIPLELIINPQSEHFSIIPISQEHVTYYIKKITSNTQDLLGILKMLTNIIKFGPTQFLFSEIELLNNGILIPKTSEKMITLKYVILRVRGETEPNNILLFTYNNEIYFVPFSDTSQPLKEQQISDKDYDTYANKIVPAIIDDEKKARHEFLQKMDEILEQKQQKINAKKKSKT